MEISRELLCWSTTPEEIRRKAQEVLEQGKKKIDERIVKGAKDEDRNFENTVRKLNDVLAWIGNHIAMCVFPHLVSTDGKIREACLQSKKDLEYFMIEHVDMNESIYNALIKAQENINKSLNEETIDGKLNKRSVNELDTGRVWTEQQEDQRLLTKFLERYQKNGFGSKNTSDAESKQRVLKLRQDISDLSNQFNTNVNSSTTSLHFTRSQLSGMSPSFMESLNPSAVSTTSSEQQEPTFEINLTYPMIFPILMNCTVEETRKELERVFASRGKADNPEILLKILKMRYEKAHLLGFECDSDYEISTKMARTSTTVSKFLQFLSDSLQPKFNQEILKLKALKDEEHKQNSEADLELKIEEWNWRYYLEKLMKQTYGIDDEKLRENFEVNKVLEGMLVVYQKLFHLQFTELHGGDCNVWHESVRHFEVFDLLNQTRKIGEFYLDLFPRKFKYSHAAAFPILIRNISSSAEGGNNYYTVTAMVANLSTPNLRHKEVETLFHEFGHICHSLLSASRYHTLNWTWGAVEQDFLEVPSMILQNWAWESSIFPFISDTPISSDMLSRMKQKKQEEGWFLWSRLTWMSKIDMQLHGPEFAAGGEPLTRQDLKRAWEEAKRKDFAVKSGEDTFSIASWQHLTTGYNAGYYSYIWSEVIAADMFEEFKKEGVLNAEVGKRFRRWILEPCTVLKAEDMVRGFLGRDYKIDTFVEKVL